MNAAAPKQFVLSTRQAAHWINDRQWAERSVTDVETVGANTTELWEFVNRSPMPHPMHIHGLFFKLLSRNGEAIDEPHFRDTVLVHPKEIVEIGTVPTDEGRWMLHCHILEHAESGMMTVVDVR